MANLPADLRKLLEWLDRVSPLFEAQIVAAGLNHTLDKALMRKRSSNGFNLVRDLHDLWLLVNESLVSITILLQAAQALRDRNFESVLAAIELTNERQRNWLMTRLKQASPQALVVPV